ncbi:24809_t:CDS:2, partial [Dentiscutata erythropus]
SRQNDPNNTVTQMDYSLTISFPTVLTTQSQQTSVRKTTEILTLIITTNTVSNLVQQPTSAVDLQFSNPPGLSGPENTLITEPNLLMADNLALLPDFTTNSYQYLSMDTHSNTTIEFVSKKSYATALMSNQKPKPQHKFSGHQDFKWCTSVLKDLATQHIDEFDKLK